MATTRPGATAYAREADKDQLIDALRESVRARDDFIAIAAHELRNPLTPILIQIEMLQAQVATGAPPGFAEGLTRLRESVDRYLRRTRFLLDVSRFTSGAAFHTEPARFDLSALVRDAVAAAGPWAARVRTDIATEIEPDVIGCWDRFGVEEIAENLLSNAIKYGAGRPVTVSLRRERTTGTIHLSIRDYGMGIAAADQARIFERFERAVGRREEGGFGIGLWLARQIACAIGGEIKLWSLPGEGSSFTLVLPLGNEQEETDG